MRIEKLDLIAYGPFSATQLDFGDASVRQQAENPIGDLHLVYGPNEAGKSSALTSVLDFLFGFPNRSASTFKHDANKVRVGATLSRSADRYSLIRKKGRKDTLLFGSNGEVCDPALLSKVLDGIDRNRYESEFGISYSQLVTGGRELAAGKGDLASALFAAASGSEIWNMIRKDLEAKSKDLYLSRGSNPKINQLIDQIAQQKNELAQMQLLPADWERRQNELLSLERRYRDADLELSQTYSDIKKIEFQHRLQPLLLDYFRCRQVFVDSGVRMLPGRELFESWELTLEGLEQEVARFETNGLTRMRLADLLQQQVEELRTLAVADEVETLLERKSRFAEHSSLLVESIQTEMEIENRSKQLRSQIVACYSNRADSGNPSASDPPAESNDLSEVSGGSQHKKLQQKKLWDEDHSEPWYLVSLTRQQLEKLDLAGERLRGIQGRAEAIAVDMSRLAEESEQFARLMKDSKVKTVDASWFSAVSDFVSKHAELPSAIQMHSEWGKRKQRLVKECDSIIQHCPEFSRQTWEEVRLWNWPSALESETLCLSSQEVDRQLDSVCGQEESIRNRLRGLQVSWPDDLNISDQAYSQLLELVFDSTKLIRTCLMGESDKNELESGAKTLGRRIADCNLDYDGKWNSAAELRTWLMDSHQFLLEKLVEVNQQRVAGADRLAVVRQIQQQVEELNEQLQLNLRQRAELTLRKNQIQESWQEMSKEIPIDISVGRILVTHQSFVRLRELGNEAVELQQKRSNADEQWREPIAELLQFHQAMQLGAELQSTPETRLENSSQLELLWRQLHEYLECCRKSEAVARQQEVRGESLRQRKTELESLQEKIQAEQAESLKVWQQSLAEAGIPDLISVQEFQTWLGWFHSLEESEGEYRRSQERRSSLQRELKSFLDLKNSICSRIGISSKARDLGLGLLGGRLTRELVEAEESVWLQTKENALQEVNELKKRLESERKLQNQKEEWLRQGAELKSLIDKHGGELRKKFSAFGSALQGVRGVDLGLRLDSETIGVDQLKQNLGVLKSEFEIVEQLVEDARILDARLEGIAKLDGASMIANRRPLAVDPVSERNIQSGPTNADETNLIELQKKLADQKGKFESLGDELAVKRRELELLERSSEAVEMQQAIEMNLAELDELCDRYLDYSMSAVLLDETMARYSQLHQHPILMSANRSFQRLTLGSFKGLKTELDNNGKKVLLGIRQDDSVVEVQGMSEGTETQLYMALRIAALEHYLSKHSPLPFVVDDVLKDYDDQRALAALKLFADLGQKTQVIVFTHHEHLLQLVENHLAPNQFQIHRLESGHARPIHAS